uniref:Uncharacterized protein n=1 Tax=Tanacetum cinerariifolium TaxID=118510 RepID=A0A699KTH3_TANCI|nr:hypothetical protein [Tanacetum cinerariifolium]
MKKKPQTESEARKNMIFYLKNTEAEDLRKRLEVVEGEDDDVFVEATPLAHKVPVVDYQIVVIDNKPRYKIIRADDTHQLYISFTTVLKNFNREDLKTLWRILFLLVKRRYPLSKFTLEQLVNVARLQVEEEKLTLPSKSKDCQSNIDAARLKLKLFKNITTAEDITK